MPKALKIILILLLFIGFFEAGLLSSYTIVTSEPPDVKGLIDLQINTIAELFSSENINSVLIKDPQKVNVTNKVDVSENLTSLAKVDGVDIDSMNFTTYSGSSEGKISVNITALAYSSPNTTSGRIVLSGTPDYIIKATAEANSSDSGITVDLNTLKIISILKFFNQTSSNSYSLNNGSDRITIG
ncbi:hypothetical protein MARBORIA2_08900 [Methanobrevibacter arboriphilus]|jgi:hypothetical protein|uniref:hypothetical protein n=1 Tax=Methanobrevibacter arboriphilus TaxID=39441 RepID=UPI0022EEB0C8|nr:hypothetical protein [Methanobrevibacter arboriphilus]MCC7562334.1 hypothetical protein [Methanobrevibacter arboriphilus]GLI11800.1 hypothetical protein MARBORIA2_08900 [Methanobrevibacter arboriphilus]